MTDRINYAKVLELMDEHGRTMESLKVLTDDPFHADAPGPLARGEWFMEICRKLKIGVQGDAELAGGDTGRSVCKVVGVRVERSQMRTLLRKQIGGSLLRFAMDAHVGDGVEP